MKCFAKYCIYALWFWKKRDIRPVVDRTTWIFDFLRREKRSSCNSLDCYLLAHLGARNAARNGEGVLHPHRVAVKILGYVDMILTHCFKSKSAKQPKVGEFVRWVPPPEGWVYLNVDAALFPSEGRMGWGAVLRDIIPVISLGLAAKG